MSCPIHKSLQKSDFDSTTYSKARVGNSCDVSGGNLVLERHQSATAATKFFLLLLFRPKSHCCRYHSCHGQKKGRWQWWTRVSMTANGRLPPPISNLERTVLDKLPWWFLVTWDRDLFGSASFHTPWIEIAPMFLKKTWALSFLSYRVVRGIPPAVASLGQEGLALVVSRGVNKPMTSSSHSWRRWPRMSSGARAGSILSCCRY